MRIWWRELPPGLRVVVIGVLVFATYLAMNLLLFRNRFDDALFTALFYTLVIAGGLHFTQKRFRKTKARLDEQGQSLMFLRYPNARPSSLSGVWQMGIASPTAGRIDFQPAVYDELTVRFSDNHLGLRRWIHRDCSQPRHTQEDPRRSRAGIPLASGRKICLPRFSPSMPEPGEQPTLTVAAKSVRNGERDAITNNPYS